MPALTLPLDFKPTHATGGLPNFPAVDLFAPAGTRVLAPAACELVWPHLIPWSLARRVGGRTAYLHVRDFTLFVTHLEIVNTAGLYARGDLIGLIARVPKGWWPEHVHLGRHRGRFNPR